MSTGASWPAVPDASTESRGESDASRMAVPNNNYRVERGETKKNVSWFQTRLPSQER